MSDKLEPKPPSINLDDPKTNQAIDDIVAKESDELLAHEDENTANQKLEHPQKPLKRFFNAIWGTPKARIRSFVFFLIALGVLAGVPYSRYFLLNAARVRASAAITVLDDKTNQPLKNVTVKIGSQEGQTDNTGKVKLSKLRLGTSELTVSKRAFADYKRNITIGLGSNPLEEVRLTPTGVQYNFKLVDFLSGKPIVGAEAVSGEYSALSNTMGEVSLRVDETDDIVLKAVITAEGYRTENIQLTAGDTTAQTVKLVPARPHVFVDQRAGKYNLYKIDADGKNEKLLLEDTGSISDDITLLPHPKDNLAAIAYNRSGKKSSNNRPLHTLLLVDINNGKTTSLGTSEKFLLVDWATDWLVYLEMNKNVSNEDPEWFSIQSYNYKTASKIELATANYFNDAVVVNGVVYWAPTSEGLPESSLGLFKANADGTGRKTLLNGEVWNLLRASYDSLEISTPDSWYKYALGEDNPTKIESPTSPSYLFTDNPNGSKSLFLAERNDQYALMVYDIARKKDKLLYQNPDITDPKYWLSNKHVVFRSSNQGSTADYVLNIEGGEPKKISDVFDTYGVENWYYFD